MKMKMKMKSRRRGSDEEIILLEIEKVSSVGFGENLLYYSSH